MSFVSFLLLLVIAGVCGAIGKSVSGYSMGGCIVSIVVGFIGAVIGQWLAHKFHFPLFYVIYVGGKAFPVVWAIIGSTLFALVVGFLFKGNREN